MPTMSASPALGPNDAASSLPKGRGKPSRPSHKGKAAKESSAEKPKISGTRVLDTVFVKDPALSESFVVTIVGTTGNVQWTIHRPIGETQLDASTEWVATPTSEVSFLLGRKESEELSAWKRKASLATREMTLTQETGRSVLNGQEVWSFDGAPACGPEIARLMAAAKADSHPESDWIRYASTPIQECEKRFKEACKGQPPKSWVAENPRPSYETCGGPLGDRRQEKVSYLTNTTLSQARDEVSRQLLGLGNQGSTKSVKT